MKKRRLFGQLIEMIHPYVRDMLGFFSDMARYASGWSGVIKVKTPTGTTLGYLLLYTNP